MTAKLLDGKALAEKIRGETARDVAELRSAHGDVPGLAAVLVGDDPASRVYVRNKHRACRDAGLRGEVIKLPQSTSEAELLAVIDRLNADVSTHGILVQLPLPKAVDPARVIDRVDPRKDVDGFHPQNLGLLAAGRPRFVACTPLGIQRMLIDYGIETKGRHVVIIGRSLTVGTPTALLTLQKGIGGDATTTVCHSATRDVAAIAREADILIAAIGKREIVRGDWIKPGAVVVDVGIHRTEAGGLAGDVAFAEAERVASWLSPVPGGVGPMTIAMLLHNTVLAAKLRLKEGEKT